jgi:hypothetical protein
MDLSDRLQKIVEGIEFCDGLAFDLWDGLLDDEDIVSLFVGYREVSKINAAVAELKSVLSEVVSPIVVAQMDRLLDSEGRS